MDIHETPITLTFQDIHEEPIILKDCTRLKSLVVKFTADWPLGKEMNMME